MNNISFYKKSIFVVLLILMLTVIIAKFSLNLIKSEIHNIVNSRKFEIYISNKINDKIENFSNKPLTQDEYFFYKDNFKKIYIKFKPIFNEIKKETE
tara:strand:+ start:560 stop:850 length:291 start_codon:yes stop_codon:yes gene_type:complete